jgi:hypothetical protein
MDSRLREGQDLNLRPLGYEISRVWCIDDDLISASTLALRRGSQGIHTDAPVPEHRIDKKASLMGNCTWDQKNAAAVAVPSDVRVHDL